MTLSQLKQNILAEFDETFKRSQFDDYSQIKPFISSALDTAVRTAFRETTITTYDKKWMSKDTPTMNDLMNMWNQALAEKTKKEEKFINN